MSSKVPDRPPPNEPMPELPPPPPLPKETSYQYFRRTGINPQKRKSKVVVRDYNPPEVDRRYPPGGPEIEHA